MIGDHLTNIKLVADYFRENAVQQYSAEKFVETILSILSNDPTEKIVEAVRTLTSIVHLPTRIFWYKVKQFMTGTFHDYEDQIRMADRFDPTNEDYPKFLEKLICVIDQTDDEKKIDWFAALTRAFLLGFVDEMLFWKLTQYLKMCTSDELEFIKSCPFEYAEPLNLMVSELYYYGLFEQGKGMKDNTVYKLSTFGKLLKLKCLNFDSESHGNLEVTGLGELKPIPIQEPYTAEEIDEILGASSVDDEALRLRL